MNFPKTQRWISLTFNHNGAQENQITAHLVAESRKHRPEPGWEGGNTGFTTRQNKNQVARRNAP